jgi:UDP:flavonoid glycosyltransferase YjiC (YdhE family)
VATPVGGAPAGRRRRVLFVAEAVTLAHVARCVTLARTLDPRAYEVRLARDPRYDRLIGDVPFPRVDIRTIPARRFFAALSRGTPIYGLADLTGYVAEDLALIEDFRPDLVVGDFRLSLAVSARLAGVGYVAIANGYWSPYARGPVPVPDIAAYGPPSGSSTSPSPPSAPGTRRRSAGWEGGTGSRRPSPTSGAPTPRPT